MHRRRPVVAPVAVGAASFASGQTPGVASLSRPGGNVTGVSLLGQEIIPKTLSLLLGSAVNPPNDYWAWRCGTPRRGAGPPARRRSSRHCGRDALGIGLAGPTASGKSALTLQLAEQGRAGAAADRRTIGCAMPQR